MANKKKTTNEIKKTANSTTKIGTGRKAVSKRSGQSSSSRGKKSTAKKGASKTQSPEGIPMKNEIQMVASFGIMLILMLSNFGFCGAVGKWLSSFFFGIFGCTQYVMPIAFFMAVTVLLANDYSVLAMKKCMAGFVVLLMISSFAQLMYPADQVSVHELFSIAIRNHQAGGILGGGIGLLLKSWFGTPGAIVIILCIFLLAMVVLTQRSFVAFFRNWISRCKKAMEQWKEESRQRKEEASKETASDKLRAKQCEDKLKEIEEETIRKKKVVSQKKEEAKKESVGHTSEPRIHVPLFTSSDEVKKKDEVKELYPEVYPFTAEDGKTREFDGTLDFSAFSFQNEKQEESYLPPYKSKGNFAVSELSATELMEADDQIDEIELQNEPDVEIIFSPDEISEEGKMPEVSEMAEEAEVPNRMDEPEEAEVLQTIEEPKEAEVSKNLDVPEGAETPETVEESEGIEQSTGLPDVIAVKPVSDEIISEKKTEQDIRINREQQPKSVPLRRPAQKDEYIFPPMNLLITQKQQLSPDYDKNLKETAMKLQSTLESFGVRVTITDISCGPTVTRYEMFPEQGTKVSKILSLTDDIKLNLAASDIRIEAPIPGKAAIGIEVPNKENLTVHFRELIDNRVFRNYKSKLAFAVGKDIGGKIVVADLAKMPHLLIAGATGSGKSVCINTLIMSILYKAAPSEVKLIMIDPKMVELSTYNGIPHLLIPVVTDPKKASGALNWAVAEMTDRYKKFTECSVRNIEGYNKKVDELIASGEVDQDKMTKMPQIVIIIDELADLMMVAPGEVEDAIVRLSQLARAAGIHLVIATQRPSVNVITGLIKANVPSRIAFSVSSGVDSRTIIDMNGAEKLLGKGDMLFYPSGYQKPVRVQGAFVSDAEVSRVVDFLKENEDVAVYDDKISEKIENKIKNSSASKDKDEYFEAAARFIMEKDKATIGMLQRMFKIGFNRAARIIDQLAEAGIVGPEEGTKPRKILMSPEQLDQYFEEYL
ncbi:MAG: DNA translocase FtsK 4TM domain-containing protein [Lachnospiraceae bacterium]|nr:DNA translocase FtsK 4TM domain-containing protein [Lachnospiraceae bacterium]